jgi:serine/threonine protein kinase
VAIDSDKRIPIPKDLNYKTSDFYDMDEDLCNEECTRLYEEFADIKKRYTEASEIASGGMKRIFRAFDQKTGRYVAQAFLKENIGEEAHGPFLAEARLTAALHHPNIIKIHDVDFGDDEKPYFTMDLKLGDSLADIINKLEEGAEGYSTKYNIEEMLDIFIKVCNAVSYSHSQGILHLDIKPDNIQVGEHGEVLLCDWGLARYTGDVESKDNLLLDNEFLMGQTLMGKVRGTPGYMAPELVNKKFKRREQTDIYALGALLYSLLTRLAPVDGSVDEILEQAAKGKIIPPVDRCPEKSIPASLNAVVMKAMSLEIKERYKSASELTEDVRKFLYGYATSAEDAGLIKEVSLFYKRNKLVSIITSLSVVMLIAFIFILENSRQNEKQLRFIAESERQKAEVNFLKYKEEWRIADLSLSADPSEVITMLKKYYHEKFLDDPRSTLDYVMKSLERIKESNDSAILLYEFKGDIHFVRQEFDLALLELQKGRGEFENSALFKALESIKEYKSDGKPAPVDVIRKLIDNLNGEYIQPLPKLLIYDNAIRADKQEHLELVKTVFLVANKISKLDEFAYNAETKSLVVSGSCGVFGFYYKATDSYVSLLETLDLEHLKVSGTGSFVGSTFQGLNLKTLDLRGLELRSKRQLIKKGIADKIIVSKKLVNPPILEALQKENNIVFEP